MSAELSMDVVASRLVWLASNVKNNIKRNLESIMAIGKDLAEAKELVAHGEWENWLKENFEPSYGLSARSAQRYVGVWTKFHDRPDLKAIPFSVLYNLTDAPESAVQEIKEMFEAGKSIDGTEAYRIGEQHAQGVRSLMLFVEEHTTPALLASVKTGKNDVREVYDITQKLVHGKESVREIATRYNMTNIEAIRTLPKFKDEYLQESLLTGFLPQTSEEPIPLVEATGRDARRIYAEINRVTHADPPEELLRCAATCTAVTEKNGKVFITFSFPKTDDQPWALFGQVVTLIAQEPTKMGGD